MSQVNVYVLVIRLWLELDFTVNEALKLYEHF